MSAFKCAADGLLLAEDVQVLFHALATSVVKTMDGRIDVLLLETKSGRVAVRVAALSIARAMATLRNGLAWRRKGR